MAAVTFFAKNTGNVNATLSYNTTSWNPVNASTYIAVAWNYTGQILQPLGVVPITTTLTIATNATGSNFSYTMNVKATEVLP
jgi:hypothetical protein